MADPTMIKRVVLEANSKFRVHGIVTRANAEEALAYLRDINEVLEAGYRITFVDQRTRYSARGGVR